MNVYQVDDLPTYYAANSVEEVIRVHFDDCGEKIGEGYPVLVEGADLDRKVLDVDEEGDPKGRVTSLRELASAADKPGFLAASDS
jgi:hypothetical protein